MIHTKSTSLGGQGSRSEKQAIREKTVTITSPMMKYTLEMFFGRSFLSVPRALRVYHVIDYRAPIFDMCRIGDLEGVQAAFADGSASPFAVNQWGSTPLYVCLMSILNHDNAKTHLVRCKIFSPRIVFSIAQTGRRP